MGYSEKLQKLCALRSLDQSTLATRVGLSKSSISRIISGVQEPKLRLAHDLAKALGVTLDYLVEDAAEVGQHLVTVTEEELIVLKIVRRLGANEAIDRLLNVALVSQGAEARGATGTNGDRPRLEAPRFEGGREDHAGASRGIDH
jgi:transcriptional regulator with XRE-family HTH domain